MDMDDKEDDRIVDEEAEVDERESASVADSDRGDKDEVVAVFFTFVSVSRELKGSKLSALNDDASSCRL